MSEIKEMIMGNEKEFKLLAELINSPHWSNSGLEDEDIDLLRSIYKKLGGNLREIKKWRDKNE